MEFERLPSGIIFDARQHESCPEPAHSQRAVDERNYYSDFRAAGTQEKTESNRRYLPLLEVTLDVHVVTTTSRTVLTQTFLNHSTVPIQQAKYTFPLYDGSAIVSFRFWVGSDKAFEGEVKPKEAAKAEYQEAVFRQRVAALLEEHTPEVFETSVGNIPARTTVKVEIVYIGELKADLGGDGVLVTIPTSVAHRYGTPPAGYIERTGTSSTPLPAENGLKIQVEVSAPAPIRKLESCTHPISVELGTEGNATQTEDFGNLAGAPGFDPKKARATLSDRTATLGKDFVLLISVADRALWSPRALVEPHPDHPEHLALMVTLAPRDLFTSHPPLDTCKAEIVLVADRSGSMECKMEALKSAIRVLLKRIPQQCSFNICSFGSNHSLLWPRSRSCSQENLNTVYHYISESFRADMGGTELLAALKHVVQQRNLEDDTTTEVIVLTDGEDWNTDQTIDFVRATRTDTNEKVRFFALGIGDSVSHRLVQGIGRQGGGFAEVVAKDTTGGWESRVIRMLTGALTPSRWQCEISLGTGSGTSSPLRCAYAKSVSGETTDTIQRPACVQAPYRIPTFHAFTQNSIYFFLDTQAAPLADSITVQAEASTGQKVTVEIQLDRIEAPAGIPIIHVLAAKALMNDLEIGQSWLHSRTYEAYRKNNTAAFEKAVQQEAESIGKRWSITGKWTSFVAVDKINQLEKTTDIYRPEQLDLSELTRPRGALPVVPTLPNSANFHSLRRIYDSGDHSHRLQALPLNYCVSRQHHFSGIINGECSYATPSQKDCSEDDCSGVDYLEKCYEEDECCEEEDYSEEDYSACTKSAVRISNDLAVLGSYAETPNIPFLSDSASPASRYDHSPLNALELLGDFDTVISHTEECQDAKEVLIVTPGVLH